jgi:hypothetical protein
MMKGSDVCMGVGKRSIGYDDYDWTDELFDALSLSLSLCLSVL